MKKQKIGIDGIDFINIYSQGNTILGRMLSNFAEAECYYDGMKFKCVEGFWYWYICGKKHDELKTMIGYNAKKFGNVKILYLKIFMRKFVFQNITIMNILKRNY